MFRRCIFVWLLLSINISYLFAQEGKEVESVRKVSEINISGLKNFKKEDILALLKTKVGESFNATTWAEDKVTLLKMGYFTTVSTDEKVRTAYVRLFIIVEEAEFKRIVNSIKVVGLKKIPEEQILANMRTRVGHEFDQQVFDRDIINLHNLSFSQDIKTSPVHTKEGYDITIVMAEDVDWYDTYKVNVRDGANAGVEKNLKEQVLLNKEGSYMDEANISMACRRIKEYLETKGFYFSDVKTRTYIKKGDKILEFIIIKGPKLKVANLFYEGNKRYTQKYLIKNARIGVRPVDHYFSQWGFFQSKLDEDKIKLAYYYNMNGFIDVKIDLQELVYNGSRDQVNITFKIEEGPRYFVGKIDFLGNNLFEREDLLSCLKNLPGSHFNVRSIYEDAKSIEGLYGDEGRLFTVVEPKLTYDSERHVVNILYAIKESGIAKIGKIIVNGNDVTKETVFLKELLLFPGDTYDRYKFEKSKASIMRLPFVDYQEVKVDVVQGDDQDVGDIVINVKEKQSGSLSFRLMYSDYDAFSGGVTISESNFDWKCLVGQNIKGGGQYVGLSAEIGTRAQRYNFNFVNPMIFDKPLRYELNTYYIERDYREYDNLILGGKTGLSTRIFGDLWWGGGYRYEDVQIRNVSKDVAQIIQDAKKNYIISAFYTFFSYDKTNNSSLPSSGYKARIEETVSEGVILGNRKFTTTKLNFANYWTVGANVEDATQKSYPYYFSFHFDASSTFYYGDDTLILSEAFFAGGNTSVRGFKPNRLGLKDGQGKLYPGNFRLVANFEFNIPLYQDIIYAAPFVDVGNVWNGIQDINFEDVRVSTGVSFKFRLPALQGQPIILTFAQPLHEKNDEKQFFAFSFMTAF